jgi:ABC-type multidrug transport system ATPase subunit
VGLMYQGALIVCDTPERIKGMVEGDLIELRPSEDAVDSGRALRRARIILAELPEVIEVQTYGDLLHVFVQDTDAGLVAIPRALADVGIRVSDVRSTGPRMEEAFISLIRRQGIADRDAETLLNTVLRS